jgi:dienelactone hydrolase
VLDEPVRHTDSLRRLSRAGISVVTDRPGGFPHSSVDAEGRRPGLEAGSLRQDRRHAVEITERTLAATIDVARVAAGQPQVRGGRVALMGVSNGCTLSLLAAEDPTLAGRVSIVAGIAPCTDLVDATRLATTGRHREGGRLVRYEAKPFLALVIAGRSSWRCLRAPTARA